MKTCRIKSKLDIRQEDLILKDQSPSFRVFISRRSEKKILNPGLLKEKSKTRIAASKKHLNITKFRFFDEPLLDSLSSDNQTTIRPKSSSAQQLMKPLPARAKLSLTRIQINNARFRKFLKTSTQIVSRRMIVIGRKVNN